MMNWRMALMMTIGTSLVIGALITDPIGQDPAYHAFIDQRVVFGIPNFMNVASNLGFLVVGFYGVTLLARTDEGSLCDLKVVWLMLYAGIVATALGSSWYHWNPSNASLTWDRLGMVIGFMSLVALVIGEYGSSRVARYLLWPLLALGLASVLYWSHTESLGRGDLRLYALVQFVPILLIPLTLLLYSKRSDLTLWLWLLIAFYVLSKIAEQLDTQIYALGHVISGHSLKHLLAALAPASLLIGLRRRLT